MLKNYLIFLTGFYLSNLSIAHANENTDEDSQLDERVVVQTAEGASVSGSFVPGSSKSGSSKSAQHVYESADSGRVLVLYDNPMEEHTVLSMLIIRDYNFKIKKELDAAIELLKKEAASLGAHAIIVLSPEQNTGQNTGQNTNFKFNAKYKAEEKTISAKAIRYKHWYY